MMMLIITIFLAWNLGRRLDNLDINYLRLQLGYLGTLLLFISMTYSIRKRWRKGPGKLAEWLTMHEYSALTGTVLIIVHAGSLYNAKIPVLATIMMVIVTVSGFIGRYLYREAVQKKKENPVNAFLANSPIRFWRLVHVQLTAGLGVTIVTHIVIVGYFGGL